MLIHLRTRLQAHFNVGAIDKNEDVSSPSILDADLALPLSARVRLSLLQFPDRQSLGHCWVTR